MKFSAILLVAMSTLALAKGDNKKSDSSNSTMDATPGKMLDKSCKSLAKWTAEVNLANNQTKLDELMTKHNKTAADVQKIKDKAANATTKLNTLKSNTTLVDTCDQAETVEKACGEMKAMMKLADLASNQTKLDEKAAKKNLTQAQTTKLKEKATQAETMMKTMMANTTLTSMCDAFKTAKNSSDGSTEAAIKALSSMNNTEKGTKSGSSSGAEGLSYSFGVLSTALIVGVGMALLG